MPEANDPPVADKGGVLPGQAVGGGEGPLGQAIVPAAIGSEAFFPIAAFRRGTDKISARADRMQTKVQGQIRQGLLAVERSVGDIAAVAAAPVLAPLENAERTVEYLSDYVANSIVAGVAPSLVFSEELSPPPAPVVPSTIPRPTPVLPPDVAPPLKQPASGPGPQEAQCGECGQQPTQGDRHRTFCPVGRECQFQRVNLPDGTPWRGSPDITELHPDVDRAIIQYSAQATGGFLWGGSWLFPDEWLGCGVSDLPPGGSATYWIRWPCDEWRGPTYFFDHNYGCIVQPDGTCGTGPPPPPPPPECDTWKLYRHKYKPGVCTIICVPRDRLECPELWEQIASCETEDECKHKRDCDPRCLCVPDTKIWICNPTGGGGPIEPPPEQDLCGVGVYQHQVDLRCMRQYRDNLTSWLSEEWDQVTGSDTWHDYADSSISGITDPLDEFEGETIGV